jgi:hypothetical protein
MGQLVCRYAEAAPKNVQRPSFVRRINEIVKNVKKQEGEIIKIVNDTVGVVQLLHSVDP